jgi:tRNA G37 N-methylase TrmD
MFYRIFSIQPDIFSSFWNNSLIARGLSKNIISYEMLNWRDKYGVGSYKQIDDKPFGGGAGMVLQPEPIYNALKDVGGISSLFKPALEAQNHFKLEPNNSQFWNLWKALKTVNSIKKATISLTPRGFPITQQVVEWLAANFDELNILCGRYEGFDARVSEIVDLELSIGNFVTNGGEAPAMSLIEGISRLLPDFVTKNNTVLHDSFSSKLNFYPEQNEFVIGKNKLGQANLKKTELDDIFSSIVEPNLFNDGWWKSNILPFIEHPQYSRPEIWHNLQVPQVLTTGDHKKIQQYRMKWY